MPKAHVDDLKNTCELVAHSHREASSNMAALHPASQKEGDILVLLTGAALESFNETRVLPSAKAPNSDDSARPTQRLNKFPTRVLRFSNSAPHLSSMTLGLFDDTGQIVDLARCLLLACR